MHKINTSSYLITGNKCFFFFADTENECEIRECDLLCVYLFLINASSVTSLPVAHIYGDKFALNMIYNA